MPDANYLTHCQQNWEWPTVVDAHGPKIDQHKKRQVQKFVNWKYKHKNVVGDALEVAVEWMKSMRREWSWKNPEMMRLREYEYMMKIEQMWLNDSSIGANWTNNDNFVDPSVEERMMECSMYPINAHVGEEHK